MLALPTTSFGVLLDTSIGLFLFYLLWSIWITFTSPLNAFPGPRFARWTNLWRLWRVWNGRAEVEQYQLHKKHGSAVRLGPNMVSIHDPAAIRVIYGRKDLWRKSDFYKVNDLFINKKRVENVFSTRDEAWNGRIMKPVIKVFAMSNILTLESRIDSTIDYMVKRLGEEFAQPGKACPIHNWVHYFAWDVIGEITFGTRMGFLEKGEDIALQMKAVEGAMDYFSVVGMMPFLDHFLDKNPIYHLGPEVFGPSIVFSLERLEMRRNGKDGHKPGDVDMLDLYLQSQEKYPDIVDEQTLLAYLMANVAAGSDTVATEMRSILYRLCTHPKDMARLRKELDDAVASPQGLRIPISWADCQTRLPFLDACVREGIRLQPAISLPLERVVPKEGFSLRDGRFLPAGTFVGINPYVMNRHEDVFGDEADQWRPERWLRAEGETEQNFQARLSNMRENEFTFGHGKRQCSGRNLAWLEIYKLIGTLLLKFDISLANPEKPWKVRNAWFIRQSDMDMIFKKRG